MKTTELFKITSELTGIYAAAQASFVAVTGFIGLAVTTLYGGWSAPFELLLWLIGVDYVSGMVASIVDKTKIQSSRGFIGLLRKGTIMLIILICHKVDVALETDVVQMGAIYFYIVNELISLIENAGRMKLPVPDQLVNIISVLKGKGGLTK
ncbi:phage holin family protein [Paenibacillus gansuensis]|uniref:Holin family protein n=1 Tax=Paenibacillus gansuensis TaxID=306542 RepID=A0ABW5PJ04_9BACL